MKKLLFMCMSIMMIASIAATYPASEDDQGYKVGDKAIDFSLKGTDGKMYSLADYKDVNGYVVVFTCNTCPYAVMYEDRMIELAKEAQAQGFAMVAINPNDPEVQPGDSFDKMVVRAKEKSFNFPYLFDEGQEVYPVYGATRTPHVYLLDKAMIVKYIGAIDDNARDAAAVQQKYVVNAMKMIKSGKSPDPSFTKAIGCSIKTKA
jgi:peroxiredoxin